MLNVGLIGFGLSGRYFHAPFLKVNPHFRLSKVVSTKVESVKEFDEAIEVVADVNDLLNDTAIDLIFVCTPNDTHYAYALAALKANKHVVIEKPFANTSIEALHLFDEAQKRNLVITAYQNRRWDSDFLTIQKLLKSKVLGEVLEYEGHFDRYRPIILTDTWKEKVAAGSGNLYNLGPHLIDQVLTLFGRPQTVAATIKTIRPDAKTDDYFDIRLGYHNMNVILKSSLMVYKNELRHVIHGTLGSFIKSGLDIQEETLRKNCLPNTTDWGAEPQNLWGTLYSSTQNGTIESVHGNYMPYYQNLYDAIVNKAELLVKPTQVLNTTKVIDLAWESNKIGQTLLFK